MLHRHSEATFASSSRKKEPDSGTTSRKKKAVAWEAPDDDEEFPGEQNVVTASMNDATTPMVADELSDEFIFTWSRDQHAREEIARQQRLLDEAAANCHRAAAARCPPTPPRQASSEVIVLDSSDEDEDRWLGGANNFEAGPRNLSGGAPSDDDGGDYTAFYRQLGM